MTTAEYAGARVANNVSLAPLTTVRVGPVARTVITCSTTDQVISALRTLDSALVLAGGSNVVIADELSDLTVVRIATTGITFDGSTVRVEAGAVWDDVVVASVRRGLGGLECLSGIPGSAGATPVQNVGAYGVEVADTITRVRLLDRGTGDVRWAAPAELGFGYRRSVLKNTHGRSCAVVLEVEFKLDESGRSAPMRYRELITALGAREDERTDPARVRAAVLALRRSKGMVLDDGDYDTWSVGSFFTNPVVPQREFERLRERSEGPVPHFPAPDGVKLAAAWLVERAGFGKGFPGQNASARLSTKHSLAVTNRGGATAADIVALARVVRDGVRDVFGITLIPEPVLVGVTI
ncbi:MAG: UDP-N-acetylmuramate dehydrogenase [Mycobacteriaceae bacterium]|nr:UDP-N-acetylmuramate dehydrogenase [Mycobacteriaceae bacterium]